jgi:hypothetical protein
VLVERLLAQGQHAAVLQEEVLVVLQDLQVLGQDSALGGGDLTEGALLPIWVKIRLKSSSFTSVNLVPVRLLQPGQPSSR